MVQRVLVWCGNLKPPVHILHLLLFIKWLNVLFPLAPWYHPILPAVFTVNHLIHWITPASWKKTLHWVCEGQDKPALEGETEWMAVFGSFWSVFLAEAPARLLGVLQSKNKNIWSVRLTARAHLLFVITYAPGPVYILLSVSTGVFIRKFVPYAPSWFRFGEQ